MPGYLQSSGPLSFDNILNINDTSSGIQLSLDDVASRRLVGNVSGPVSMFDMYGRGVILNPNTSAYGNGVYSPTFSLSGNFPQFANLPSGTAFYVTSYVSANWAVWNINPTYTFYKGSSATYQTGGSGGKNYYMRTIYDGGNSVYLYGFYSGGSTNFPNGTIILQKVRLV